MAEPTSAPGRDSPEAALAEGFAMQVARWSAELGAPPDAIAAASLAARVLSTACAAGEVCIELDEVPALADATGAPRSHDWPAEPGRARALLLDSRVVGPAASPGACPLVLDALGRLYLHRYFDYERRLARRLRALRATRPDLSAAHDRLRARLGALFAANAATLGEETDWQRLAVALALSEGVAVVSGGPGTGKTTMVVNLLACLLDADPGCRIALAAPTGKAAARMAEAIRERARHLPPEIAARLPANASTVHRLLRVRGTGGFVHGPDDPLPIDVLVVDEASMLDLALATKLLEAVPPGARVVLLGDKDQLAAVEAGSVFADLSHDAHLGDACRARLAALADVDVGRIVPPAPVPGPIPDGAIWLTRTWRFAPDSRIGQLARLVVEGRADELAPWIALDAAPEAEVRVVDDDPDAPDDAVVAAALRGLERYRALLDGGSADPAALTDAFVRFRVLCAVRDGPRGVVALNAAISRRVALGERPGGVPTPTWYVGRPVIVLRNDPLLRLFNGDVGLTVKDDAGAFAVAFPDAGGGYRLVAPVRLPEHETAFAMTVHKSQGSEFDHVLVVLPDARSRVLTRELLYTAVTRARTRATLFASAAALRAAVSRATRRRSGLAARLAAEPVDAPAGRAG